MHGERHGNVGLHVLDLRIVEDLIQILLGDLAEDDGYDGETAVLLEAFALEVPGDGRGGVVVERRLALRNHSVRQRIGSHADQDMEACIPNL